MKPCMSSKPATVGDILVGEFLKPLGISQARLADLMEIEREYVKNLCMDKDILTPYAILKLSTIFNTSQDFWRNIQLRTIHWERNQKTKLKVMD